MCGNSVPVAGFLQGCKSGGGVIAVAWSYGNSSPVCGRGSGRAITKSRWPLESPMAPTHLIFTKGQPACNPIMGAGFDFREACTMPTAVLVTQGKMNNMDEVYYYERLRTTEAPTTRGAVYGWIGFAMVLATFCWTLV